MAHEKKYCPRCTRAFECKLGSILLCQCSTVKLNDAERDYLKEHYHDCLCAGCMQALRDEYNNTLFRTKLKKLLGLFYPPASSK